MRSRKQVSLQVEQMEQKALLSALPVFTHRAFNHLVHEIHNAAGTFAKTQNQIAFATRIGNLSFQVPYGNAELNPKWQVDIGIYSPAVPRSGLAMVSQLKIDLANYVRAGVASGAFRFK